MVIPNGYRILGSEELVEEDDLYLDYSSGDFKKVVPLQIGSPVKWYKTILRLIEKEEEW